MQRGHEKRENYLIYIYIYIYMGPKNEYWAISRVRGH